MMNYKLNVSSLVIQIGGIFNSTLTQWSLFLLRVIKETVPIENQESLQSLIFIFLIRKLYRSEDDILKLPFHIIRYRIKQLEDYDKKMEENHKKQESEMKAKSRR